MGINVNMYMVGGRLGQDPEIKDVGATKMCKFSVATSQKWKDKTGELQERPTWHRVVTYGALAEQCAKNLKKGSQVWCHGMLENVEFDGKDGNKVRFAQNKASKVEFIDGMQKKEMKQDDGFFTPPNFAPQ